VDEKKTRKWISIVVGLFALGVAGLVIWVIAAILNVAG
jgi:hypothetical protein